MPQKAGNGAVWPVVLNLHLGLAWALWVASGVMAGIWWRRRKNSEVPVRIWQYQGILQVAVLLQGALGLWLYETGPRPRDPLHVLYGVVLAVIVVVERSLLPAGRLRALWEADWGRFAEGWGFFWLNLLTWLVVSRAISTGLWGI
ncbi:MAG: hypothetical protein K6U14_09415 [Firmicutes bacterium]|nr:hypothetical protein [Alicyclobacillaceae bacterium]MCL6497830.1 hypothetical protein [Bacillota bacterium]